MHAHTVNLGDGESFHLKDGKGTKYKEEKGWHWQKMGWLEEKCSRAKSGEITKELIKFKRVRQANALEPQV